MKLIVLAWKNLRRKGLRTLLTMLGIAIGVASVVLISSVGTLGTKAVNNELDSLGLNGISVSAQADAPALDDIDLQMVRNVQQVEQAMPILTQNGVIQTFAGQQQVMLWGLTPAQNRCCRWKFYTEEYSRIRIFAQKPRCAC